MPDEKTEVVSTVEIVASVPPVEKTEAATNLEQAPKKAAEPQVVAPVPVKKSDPVDEFAETIDHFLTSVQSSSVKSVKSLLAQMMAKADAVITKLDVATGGDPPKKQG